MRKDTAPLSADACCQVLAAALECSKCDVFQRMWMLPAVASLQGKHLEQLLRCAIAAAATPYGGWCAAVAVDSYLKLHPAWSSVNAAACGRHAGMAAAAAPVDRAS